VFFLVFAVAFLSLATLLFSLQKGERYFEDWKVPRLLKALSFTILHKRFAHSRRVLHRRESFEEKRVLCLLQAARCDQTEEPS
jgi:hypothetical protein